MTVPPPASLSSADSAFRAFMNTSLFWQSSRLSSVSFSSSVPSSTWSPNRVDGHLPSTCWAAETALNVLKIFLLASLLLLSRSSSSPSSSSPLSPSM